VARRNVHDIDACSFSRSTLAFIGPAHASPGEAFGCSLMMETEIWPNLLRECKKKGVGHDDGERKDFDAVVPAVPHWSGRFFQESPHGRRCAFCMQSEEIREEAG